jgi:fused signal recognition particle receptor
MSMFTWFRRRKATDVAPRDGVREPAAEPLDPLDSLRGVEVSEDAAPEEPGDSLPTTALQLRADELHDARFGSAAPAPAAAVAQPAQPTLPEPIAEMEPLELLHLSDEAANPETRPPAEDLAKALHKPGDDSGFFARLKNGLRRTGNTLTSVFINAQIDDDLYEELETALLVADAGVGATQWLLNDLKLRVKQTRTTDAQGVRALLEQSVAELLRPLEATLAIGEHRPTVLMTVGVNGAGKTTTIGKLTHHLQNAGMRVILAAGDTFRAAAREQLAVWADRNRVTIISRNEADPSSVIFDAVQAGVARHAHVVIADTAGRLPTQLHLMEELKKIRRTIAKAMPGAPHEVLLVLDGNTGQNALAQVKAFDEALQLTGLVVTKLDGTAKGGMLCGIARWSQTQRAGGKPLPVYFIGVGEQLEDLQPFNAAQFAKALVG